MTSVVKDTWYWTAGFIFLVVIFVSLTLFGSYYIPIVTAIAVTGGGVIFYMTGIKWAFHTVLLTLPLSVNLTVSGESQVMFPSELLVSALGVSVVIYWIRNGTEFTEFFKHPVTILLAGYLSFVLISVVYSEMLIVSLKSIIIKFIYVTSFYGGAYIYFKNQNHSQKFFKYYLFSLIIIVGFVLTRHSEFSFSKDVSGFVTKPFFQDHTIYSAAVAFMLPLVAIQLLKPATGTRINYLFIFLLLIAAILLAGSRAAWLSVGVAICFGILLVFRFPMSGFAVLVMLSGLIVISKSDELVWMLKLNRADSNARNANISDQTRSVINITNDQSNAERLNRWKCAWRMFNEKPITGFGPGTYQFSYFPFQREKEMTRISVTSPYNIEEGKGGTAHNEFLLILAESGAGAAFCFITMVLLTFVVGIRLYYIQTKEFLNMAMLLAFTTFVIHSLFNNFLDTDKTAALFFISLAYFTAADHINKKLPNHVS